AITAGGASRQGGLIAHAVIEIASALILFGIIWRARSDEYSRAAWILVGIALLAICAALAQLVPLPASIWTELPGRDIVVAGFAAMNAPLPALPATLTPERTFAAVVGFLPPLAAFAIFARQASRQQSIDFTWAAPIAAGASVLLGIAQIYGGPTSPLYLYAFTNRGFPVGFFANVNHQATLALMAAPFVAALIGQTRARAMSGHAEASTWLFVIALGFLVMLSAMIAGSFAGYVLLGPTLAACAFIALGFSRSLNATTGTALFAVVAALGGLGWFVASSPALQSLGVTDLGTGPASRVDLFARTGQAVAAYFPFGSGLGSFERVYPIFEAAAPVGNIYAPHAHNDYLQVAMELGLPGILALAGVILWWAVMTWRVWSAEISSDVRIRRAASVALGVVALHSIVDYPLRTAAIAVFAGACAGILAAPAVVKRRDILPNALPAKHVDL
ncbi:MAG: hypothetical protein EBZ50_10360, partial [Alphaproteobacteria bacterium]|nr:hypothetical protein [Alphaproteobacteria bacterium]